MTRADTRSCVCAQFRRMQRPILNDILMRSGVVWGTLKKHSAKSPHLYELNRKKEMLELLTLDQVVEKAKSAASESQGIHVKELYEAVQKAMSSS